MFVDIKFMSSGSAVAGFPCSRPPLKPIKKASSIKWRLFYIEKSFFNQQILGIGPLLSHPQNRADPQAGEIAPQGRLDRL